MRLHRSLAVGASCALGFAAVLGTASSAHADYAPAPSDIVGVGSDTVQNVMNFVADNYTNGDQGVNSAGNVNRLVSFDATPDENDRAGYLPSSQGSGNLNPTIVLREGTNPVQRPNGSGSGVAALIADYTNSPENINYTRSSSINAIVGAATAQKPLHAVRLATDDIVMGVNNASTNAPASISGSDLVNIYNCTITDWHTLNAAAPVGSTIVPLYPQPGSGTGKTFLGDLNKIATGSSATPFAPGACAQVSEENDPAAITGQSSTNKPNAIAPFSSGRINLYNAGYFHDPSQAFPTPTAITPGIKLIYGSQTANACTAPAQGQTTDYCRTRGIYVAWRGTDDTAAPAQWQPGIAKSWIQALFAKVNGSTSTPYVNSTPGKALIADAGVTPAYVDCGITTGSAFTGSCSA